MIRAPRFLRTAGGLLGAGLLMAAAPALPSRYTGDVTGVSLRPATNRAELVIDVRGVVNVSDFVLANPARVVVDLVGARLVAPQMTYDGTNRGGVRNVRYAQFRPDVVRVVVELESARDYDVRQNDGAVHVGFESAGDFAAWTTSGSAVGESRMVSAPSEAAPAAATAVVRPESPATGYLSASLPAAIPPRVAAPRTLEPAVQQPAAQGQGARIRVSFDHATIQEVIQHFASFSGNSIVLGKDITGEVTADIRDQPWDIALNAILAGQGLAAVQLPGGIIRVDSRAVLSAQDSTQPTSTRVVQIDYARASLLAPSIAGVVSARGKLLADSITNSIIVTEISSRIAEVEAFIRSLDQRTPQVAIQARIVFVDRTELEDLGVRYDLSTATQFYTDLIPGDARTPPSTSTANPVVNLGGNAVAAIANASAQLGNGNAALKLVYSTVIGDFALTSFVEALTSVSLADLQAEPSVTVADNRPANIFSGEDTPIRQVDPGAITGGAAAPRSTTTFKRTGIKLDVTPHVVAGTREILMTLHAERSQLTPSSLSEIGAIFSTQEANTQLLVRDGETAVIGGLTVTEITVTKSGIPFLVDLPVIGPLFGFRSNREQRRDLLILVTPHIVDDLTTVGTGGQNR